MDIDDILGLKLDEPRGPMADAAKAEGAAPPAGRALKETVTGVAQMLHDLEAQLVKVMSINEALEKELGEAREAMRAAEKQRDGLQAHLDRLEQEGATVDDVRAEVLHLQRERREMAERLDAVQNEKLRAETEHGKALRELERVAAERDDALEEARCLEAQFGRAMQAVGELRGKVEDLTQQRDTLATRIRTLEGELGVATESGEALRLELEESKKAIEEIRRSILEVGAHSQRLTGTTS
jgi:chromosome segregation ATPase